MPKAHIQFGPPLVITSVSSAKEDLASEKEWQHLDMFRRLFVAGISDYHRKAGWESLILQAIREEPAVRHAAIAFSAL